MLRQWTFGWGEPPAASHLVLEREYRFPMVTHFAIEPHVFVALPTEDGITVVSPIQHPFVLQRVVAAALGWPLAKVRIVAPDPGGGFGGKGWPKFEPLVAMLALRLGRPVRLVLTLEETFQAVRRTSARIRARTAFDRDGHILSQSLFTDFLIGAYADIGVRVVSKASYAACGPYRTPHAHIAARALLSHTTPSTAFRGFGTPQASWAVESQLTEAARILGLDPIEIRRRNLARKGEAFIPNDTPADGDWLAALDAAERGPLVAYAPSAQSRPRPGARPEELLHRLGVAGDRSPALRRQRHRAFRDVGHGAGGADGPGTDRGRRAGRLSGSGDGGDGRHRPRALRFLHVGEPLDRLHGQRRRQGLRPHQKPDSRARGPCVRGQTSRPSRWCRVRSRVAISRRSPTSDVLTAAWGPPRGELIGVGEERGGGFRPDHPLGGRPEFWEFMCTAVEVEVDRETGMVDVTRLVLASDVGKALNPQQVEAQDEGAAVMGLGHSFMEELLLDSRGRIRNLGALDYRVPTIQDIPRELHSVLIENADGPGPYGAKGAGEGGILGIGAAVGAAVSEATGVYVRELPMTPERIWRALHDAASSPSEGVPE